MFAGVIDDLNASLTYVGLQPSRGSRHKALVRKKRNIHYKAFLPLARNIMACSICRAAPAQLYACPVTLDIYCGDACHGVHWDFIAGKGKRERDPAEAGGGGGGGMHPRLAEVLRIVASNPAAVESLVRLMDGNDVMNYAMVSREFNRIFVGSRFFWYVVLRTRMPDHDLVRNPYNFNTDYKAAVVPIFKSVLQVQYHARDDLVLFANGLELRARPFGHWVSKRLSYVDIVSHGGLRATLVKLMVSKVILANDENEEDLPFWSGAHRTEILLNGNTYESPMGGVVNAMADVHYLAELMDDARTIDGVRLTMEQYGIELTNGVQSDIITEMDYEPDIDGDSD